ncbi:PAS domain-containing protein [Acinetobacter terrae]|uniref:PAS domain-containing protein n=1 Tax=Acinetobacter terrae TaxID=2731247 RepID=UPI0007D847FE|nr:PAS domain-containing protein [Acinetobacter terrae]OAL83113.1 hypothetical protein AY608_15385 [Acinetobacter terrae]
MQGDCLIQAAEQNVIGRQYWTPIFDQFQQIVLFIDQDFNIHHSNRSWQQFTQDSGLDGPLSVQNLKLWIYPEDIELLQQCMYSKQAEPPSIRFFHPDKGLFWFALCANFLELADESSAYWCLIGTEQTAKVKVQVIQDAQQRSLNELLKRLPVMIYRSRNDWNWTMEYVSSGCQALTGFQASELLNTPRYGEMIHPADQHYVWENIQHALHNHSTFHIHYRIITPAQKIRDVQEIGQGLYSESDMVLGVEGIIFYV